MRCLETLYEQLAEKWGCSVEEAKKRSEQYSETLVEFLVQNGYVQINEDLRLEVIPIQPRHYVLKGNKYNSSRSYKLKASMGNPIYDKVVERYDQFREYE